MIPYSHIDMGDSFQRPYPFGSITWKVEAKDDAKFTMEKFDKARRDRDITYFETKLAAETDIIEHMGCSMEFKE